MRVGAVVVVAGTSTAAVFEAGGCAGGCRPAVGGTAWPGRGGPGPTEYCEFCGCVGCCW